MFTVIGNRPLQVQRGYRPSAAGGVCSSDHLSPTHDGAVLEEMFGESSVQRTEKKGNCEEASESPGAGALPF